MLSNDQPRRHERDGGGHRSGERQRLSALHEYGLLDAPVDEELEAVVRLAAAAAGLPTAALNLIDGSRQCQLTTVGFAGGDTPRSTSMCAVRFLDRRTVRVTDASTHPDYADNPWVTGQLARVRCYVSVPLVTPRGHVLGTLCAFDAEPHALSDGQVALLEDAGRVITALFERRRQARINRQLAAQADEQRDLLAHTLTEMEARQQLTDAVLETVDVGIVAADATGRLTLFNRAARDWHGLDADHDVDPTQHATRYDLHTPDGTHPLAADQVPLALALRDGTVDRVEMLIAPESRPAVHVVTSGRAIHDHHGTLLGAVVAMTDVTSDRRRHAQLQDAHLRLQRHTAIVERQASHDSLTGLPNRAVLHDHLARALDRSRRDGTSTAVLFIDLDAFKAVNDRLGHDTGDRLLVHVADRLRQCARGGDLVVRLGGDEFVMICQEVPGLDAARAVAARVAVGLSGTVDLAGHHVDVTGSVGIAVSGPASTPEQLLADADTDMYRVKQERQAARRTTTTPTPRRPPEPASAPRTAPTHRTVSVDGGGAGAR